MPSPPNSSLKMMKPKVPDEKDIEINKLRAANKKLQNKIKDLNITVERTIEKAHELSASKKKDISLVEAFRGEQDVEKLLKIRDKEIENSQKLI